MNEISWDEFAAVDIRVGTVIDCKPFKQAINPSYVLRIDFGELGVLKSSAQITDRYTCEDLVGTQVTAVVNFPAKQIANIKSQCLVLAAVEDGTATFLRPDSKIHNGTRIS
jgi:tRNA-binding protein